MSEEDEDQRALIQKLMAAVADQGSMLTSLAAKMSAPPPAKPADPASPSLLEIWPFYERAEKVELRSWRTTEHRWRLHVSQPFGPDIKPRSLAAIPCMEITLELIDDYRAWRLEERTKNDKRITTIATVNREVALLRRVLNFAVERKLIPFNPIRGVKQSALIKTENNVRQTVIEEFHPEATVRLGDLLRKASPVMKAAILMSHGSGLRREEMSLARWDRLDMRTGVLFIPDADTKGGVGGREVILTPEALQAIAELPRDFRERGGPILVNSRTGGPYQPDYFSKRFRELCNELGLKGPDGAVWFHDCRRAFVTLARRRGEDTSQIRQLSGHKTDSVFQRYNVFSRKDLLAAKKRMREAREQEREEFEQLREQEAIAAGERKPAIRSVAPTVGQSVPVTILKKGD